MRTKNQFLGRLARVASAFFVAVLPYSCDFKPIDADADTEADAAPVSAVYGVEAARGMEGSEDVWVAGYIVGCASPFLGTDSETNLAIADSPAQESKDSCMSVELKKGSLRDALNIVSNPGNLGRRVYVKGDIVQYYKMPGIKNITSWSLDNLEK